MKRVIVCLVIATVVFACATCDAVPTAVTVRVISKGAKFVGTSMGGVRITLRDKNTGELLAKGVTQGSTGNTETIMKTASGRNAVLSDDQSAKFTTTIDIQEPKWVEVTAYGPLAQLQSANTVSSTQWIIPGKPIDGGDAWLLELTGFVVDILSPPAHVKLGSDVKAVQVRANVTMMCGCPILPGGLWDANQYEIRALVRKDGERSEEIPLSFADQPSQFEASIPVKGAGVYEVTVYAYDASNGNTGMDKATYMVE